MPLARAACAVGYEVHVACPPGCAAEQLKSEGFAVHLVALDRRSVNPFRELNTIAALYRVYKRVRPDIVHHMRLKPVLYGGLAARLARVPAVVNLLTGLGYLFVSSSLTARCLRPLVMSASRVGFHPLRGLAPHAGIIDYGVRCRSGTFFSAGGPARPGCRPACLQNAVGQGHRRIR